MQINNTKEHAVPERHIAFSPPDITQEEIDEVVDTLQSGWITTGPKTARFEEELAAFVGTNKVNALASCTAALECGLRLLGIGPGDEVITTAYTYSASASSICHVGATPVLVDVAPDTFEMDYDKLPECITDRTRAIIPVDVAGRMVDYEHLESVLEACAPSWHPANEVQERIGRLPILADTAHSLGAMRHGKTSGTAADLSAFSFHAVKNLTTAEGGALTWRPGVFDDEWAHHRVNLMALHGQSKNALEKDKAGAWEYDIEFTGWKCNMTDIMAALGLAQLRRYPALLARRRDMVAHYEAGHAGQNVSLLKHYEGDPRTTGFASSGHLMLVRLLGHSRAFCNEVIQRMAEAGISTNVHYKPLPLLTAYKNLGFDIANFPNAMALYENEITLPLHTLLSDDDIDYIIDTFIAAKDQLESEGLK